MPHSDPFDTESLRQSVLDAWTASPARFREDANAEEDYALGGYRDRVIVELAQNAADAALRAGEPGHLRLTLTDGVLTAANTGAPLDTAGVVALSTLRASGKRSSDDAGAVGAVGAVDSVGAIETAGTAGIVGRFGVGFAATVAVSDSPSIASATGAVRWSRAESASLVASVPSLAAELAAREGHVPVLRLPYPSGATPPDGFATSVTLPLRDDDTVALAKRLLAETGPALLLALPALASVTITTDSGTRELAASRDGGHVTITGDGTESVWRTVSASGTIDPGLLADRPTEERARPAYSIQWAFSRTPRGSSSLSPRLSPGVTVSAGEPGVVHAPTPTGEPLGLPALLLASFPLSPDRRHVAPGPLTDFLVAQAAALYASFLPSLAADADGSGAEVLDLVPGPIAEGALDGQLRRAILELLPETAFVPAALPADTVLPAGGGGSLIRPRDAVVLEAQPPGLAEYLAPVLGGLVAGSARHPAYRVLGVRRLPLAELADILATLDRPPSWWHGLYEILAGLDAGQRAELGALPVPLADGRLVRGPRGLLLPGSGLSRPDKLSALGLRVVDEHAAHPLLTRLGAVEATPRGVLSDPATQAAVEASLDEEDPLPVAEAVLGLVSAAGELEPGELASGELAWLGNLALPGDDGGWYPADELLLPGGVLASVVGDDAPFGVVDADFASRWGAEALEGAGVLGSFGLLRAQDVDLGDDPDLDVDGADEWADWVRARLRIDNAPGSSGHGGPGPVADVPPLAPEILAVRDLDLVDPERWPRALELLAAPPLRAALVEPARVLLGDGRAADVPSYTAWWLREHMTLGGQRVSGLRSASADPLLDGLYDPADPSLAPAFSDPAIAHALGVRTSLSGLLAEPGGADDLLRRLADRSRPVTRGQLRDLWTALASAPGLEPGENTAPDRVRALRGGDVVVAAADDALVLDAPDLWPLVAGQPLVLAPHDVAFRLADLLDLPLASEEVAGTVESSGTRRPVPVTVLEVLPDAPEEYWAHDKLTVDGTDVPWRCRDGEVHVSSAAGPTGLGCALAWAAGQWPLRHLVAALLTAPDDAPRLLADADLDPS